MREVVDNTAEGHGERLTPSCDVEGLGEAFPPRRIVAFTRAIDGAGGGGVLGSICQPDWSVSMDRFARQIGRRDDS